MKRFFICLCFILFINESQISVEKRFLCSFSSANTFDWEILINALMIVESDGDSLARGKTNDLGILQLTPIYVKDVNRILKKEKYTLNDRKNKQKSLEMFNIFQNHYNPEHNILKAIKLQNPGAGDWYKDRIYEEMIK